MSHPEEIVEIKPGEKKIIGDYQYWNHGPETVFIGRNSAIAWTEEGNADLEYQEL